MFLIYMYWPLCSIYHAVQFINNLLHNKVSCTNFRGIITQIIIKVTFVLSNSEVCPAGGAVVTSVCFHLIKVGLFE